MRYQLKPNSKVCHHRIVLFSIRLVQTLRIRSRTPALVGRMSIIGRMTETATKRKRKLEREHPGLVYTGPEK